jgi:hypothetical protein
MYLGSRVMNAYLQSLRDVGFDVRVHIDPLGFAILTMFSMAEPVTHKPIFSETVAADGQSSDHIAADLETAPKGSMLDIALERFASQVFARG